MKKIVLAIGGSSGSIYTKVLMDKLVLLQNQWEAVGVVMSDNAKYNWKLEIGDLCFQSPISFLPIFFKTRVRFPDLDSVASHLSLDQIRSSRPP